MKNLALLLLLLPFIFNSCGSDDNNDSISLKEREKTLKYSETYQINATSENKITYTSENEYHTRVSESGLVTAGRFGETNVILTDGNDTKKVKIIVKKSSELYPDPNIDWGISKTDLIKKFGTPDSETDSGIGYDDFSSAAPIILFLFDSNNKLKGTSVMVKTAFSSELGTYLGERYLPIASQDYTIFFINSTSFDTATMAVGAEVYNLSYWMVLYFPYSNKKSTLENQNDRKEIRKLMEQL